MEPVVGAAEILVVTPQEHEPFCQFLQREPVDNPSVAERILGQEHLTVGAQASEGVFEAAGVFDVDSTNVRAVRRSIVGLSAHWLPSSLPSGPKLMKSPAR